MDTDAGFDCTKTYLGLGTAVGYIGLGTTIAGFIQSCGIAGYQPLLDLIAVPPKHKIVGTLMVGYPKYKYQRMPERQHLKVDFR